MVVVWDTSRCGKSGEVSVIAKAHTDVDIARIKIAPFDDTRLGRQIPRKKYLVYGQIKVVLSLWFFPNL